MQAVFLRDKKMAPQGVGPKQANTDVRPGEDSVAECITDQSIRAFSLMIESKHFRCVDIISII